MTTQVLERTLTELDHVRLTQLARAADDASEEMQAVLDAARLVPSREVPPDVVTMQSQVLLAFDDGRREKVAVCYPKDAAPAEGRISVLSPVGTSLLGLRVGETARWHTPTGNDAAADVVELLFQPEANGDYLA